MRFPIFLLVASFALTCVAKDRYEAKLFGEPRFGFVAVVDTENGKSGWDSAISSAYGTGADVALPLKRMVRRWNRRGIHPEDERNLNIELQHKGVATFPMKTRK